MRTAPAFLVSCLLLSPAAHAVEEGKPWNIRFQATTVTQGHPAFGSPYEGANSLPPSPELETSLTSTLFVGRSLWTGAEAELDPEVSAGKGIGSTRGVAGFPNGEVFRVDTAAPKLNLARLYLKQSFGPEERYALIAGKFSLNDFFDNNAYSHDPRSQFLNWALMDNGAWDYAADTRGYTWGLYGEYRAGDWSARAAIALEPKEANGLELDTNLAQAHGDQLEIEHRHSLGDRPGAVRLLGYLNHAHMGSYAEALSDPAGGVDVTRSRDYRTKYGFGINVEQKLAADLGVFSRVGWNDGATESWTFTEIDRTFTIGASLQGAAWSRPDDVAGLALILNGLSRDHASYLAAGGYGFLIGDGALNYAPEEILEALYSLQAVKCLTLSADYQFVIHPAYNADRGPVQVVALRAHLEL